MPREMFNNRNDATRNHDSSLRASNDPFMLDGSISESIINFRLCENDSYVVTRRKQFITLCNFSPAILRQTDKNYHFVMKRRGAIRITKFLAYNHISIS